MSVLVDATALASGHRWRGIGKYVRHLVRGLATRVPDHMDFLTLSSTADEGLAGRAVPLKPAVPRRWEDLWPWYARSLPRVIRAGGYTLYHSTAPEASTSRNAFKTLATVYDLIPYALRPRWSFDPRYHWRWQLYRLYLGRIKTADHIIAISKSTAQALTADLHFPASRISVIPLGVDRAEHSSRAGQPRGDVSGRYLLPVQYWLTVTSPNPNKGWLDLIKALAVLRGAGVEVPLAIAGHWLPKQRRQLMQAAQSLEVSGLLRFLGYVPDEDLPGLYEQALAFVFPSRREGFGLPVLEAMAAGTPVLVSDDPALQELTADAALSFPRGEPTLLADNMALLAGNSELRRTLGGRGARRSELFTWERMVDRTLEVYETLIPGLIG